MAWFSVNERLCSPDTSGPSFTSVTVTVTSSVPELKLSSRACTVTRYWLLSEPDPWGDSKFGGLAKASTPVSLMAKSSSSVPDSDQVMADRSGSVARKV